MLAEGKPHITVHAERMTQNRVVMDEDVGALEEEQWVIVRNGRGDAMKFTGQRGIVQPRDYNVIKSDSTTEDGNTCRVKFDSGVETDVKRVYLRRIVVEECLVGNAVEFT